MPHVEVGQGALGPGIAAVLREIGIARAREETGCVVDGLRPGIRRESRQSVLEPLLEAGLKAVIIRVYARFQDVDVGELRYGARIDRLRAGQRLVEIARTQKLGAFRADVRKLDDSVAAKLMLDVHVPLLRIRRPQISLNRERG